MKIRVKSLFGFLFVLFFSCSEYTPKPIGYNRIDDVLSNDIEYDFSKFSFKYSDQIRIDSLQSKQQGEIWFNIVYPQYDAVVYCTYLPISKGSLPKILDDSYKLAFSHISRADEINQKMYSKSQTNVFGTIYSIEGDVATPIQFYVTDSVSNFFRGSLYYNKKVNSDSVAPITEFVLNDIVKMIDTYSWK